MLVAVGIVTGFKNEITRKVVGFGSHIRLSNFDNNQSLEEVPVSMHQPVLQRLQNDNRIAGIHAFATKAGIIRSKDDILGVVVKGLDHSFNAEFFKSNLTEGSFQLQSTGQGVYAAVVSQHIVNKMKLKLHDTFVVYFIDNPPRARKFKIEGIYATGLEDFDDIYVFTEISVIQKLNGWRNDQAGGFEINLKQLKDLDEVQSLVYQQSGFNLNAQSIKSIYPEIFHWLELQDVNVVIILVLMILVAGINMISTLLIIILENTTTIGLLKALGAQNVSIRKIFLLLSSGIAVMGIVAGNILGLTLCYLQYRYHFITLPQESYYVSYVPVNFSLWNIVLINAGTMVACIAVMIIPSVIVSRISPVKALRYE